jgi:pimeloyl-ACP methyl ester carboxylesterase
MRTAKNLSAGSMMVASAFAGLDQAQSHQPPVKNIVLVHGAFADGSSWGKVIPILEARGFHVVAVQNPLTSLSERRSGHSPDHVAGGDSPQFRRRTTDVGV